MDLDVGPFRPWVNRSFSRAREIAGVDVAQRVLLGTSRLWMSLARGLLSPARRDRAIDVWAEERGLALYRTSSDDM